MVLGTRASPNAHQQIGRSAKMATSEGRFDGVLGGKDYDYFLYSARHGFWLQAAAAKKVAEYCEQRVGEPVTAWEIGVGTGLTTEHILRANKDVRVVACDISQKMLDAAEQNIGHDDRVELVLVDALDFIEQHPVLSLDVVVNGFGLHNLQKDHRDATMLAIADRLKPGGIFVWPDKIARDDEVAHYQAMIEQMNAFSIFLKPHIDKPDVFVEWMKHYRDDDLYRVTESEIRTLFEAHGCTVEFSGRVMMDVLCHVEKK